MEAAFYAGGAALRSGFGPLRSTGNAAFDDYREETLRRLEEEADEFQAFLQRLRKAKDKAEFDQFMAERRTGPRPAPRGPKPRAKAKRGNDTRGRGTSVPRSFCFLTPDRGDRRSRRRWGS